MWFSKFLLKKMAKVQLKERAGTLFSVRFSAFRCGRYQFISAMANECEDNYGLFEPLKKLLALNACHHAEAAVRHLKDIQCKSLPKQVCAFNQFIHRPFDALMRVGDGSAFESENVGVQNFLNDHIEFVGRDFNQGHQIIRCEFIQRLRDKLQDVFRHFRFRELSRV